MSHKKKIIIVAVLILLMAVIYYYLFVADAVGTAEKKSIGNDFIGDTISDPHNKKSNTIAYDPHNEKNTPVPVDPHTTKTSVLDFHLTKK